MSSIITSSLLTDNDNLSADYRDRDYRFQIVWRDSVTRAESLELDNYTDYMMISYLNLLNIFSW